jgi:hypothetical protein
VIDRSQRSAFADADYPAAEVFLLSAIPRMMHLEPSLRTTTSHADAQAMIMAFLDDVERKNS